MAFMKYGGAVWRPIDCNFTRGGNHPKLLIVHHMEGTLAGTDGWFRNESAEASAHFGVDKDGLMYQWVDTSDTAWHAANANTYSVGVECEGYSGQEFTTAQITALAKLYAWTCQEYPAVSTWLTVRPSGSGLAWHGLGGSAWGGHVQCPGAPAVRQLPAVLARAEAILHPSPATVSADGQTSLTDLSEQTGVAVSTLLKWTASLHKPAAYGAGMSGYLQAGDLRRPMAAGVVVAIQKP